MGAHVEEGAATQVIGVLAVFKAETVRYYFPAIPTPGKLRFVSSSYKENLDLF